MRQLSSEETELLRRRSEQLASFLSERMPVLADFAVSLELDDPPTMVADPGRYVPSVDAFIRNQVVEEADRPWIVTRLGYLIGEVLIQKFRGHWFLNDLPDSRYFGGYVVGQFTGLSNPCAMIDPFEFANAIIALPPGRSLRNSLAELERDLRAA